MGSQTVGVVTYTQSGTPGRLGLKTRTRTVTLVSGVHFRPLNAREKKDVTDTAAQVWKLTADGDFPLLGVDAEIVHDGTLSPTYPVNPLDGTLFHVIAGALPKYDLDVTVPHHVTVMCERQSG